ncbi:transmembrane protein 104 isoform X3 [Ornithorhynchus anatinus]|uniref:transmembrane protein 104 isoform X3 n=1 Tax=Ornithorhynchus anatinus TaxID=9258 RepID=UPI0010A7FA62|nr:transmembrane protein 104 isoform X3 [Ornithorhynchus anatinus]
MAGGGITEPGELYSPYVGLVYMFNLIVGTGALTMPKAFATAGWLVSLVLLVFLGFMSYVTTTFVMEAMAAANARLCWKRMERHKEDEGEEDDDDQDSSSATSDDDDPLVPGSFDRSETRPILAVQRRGPPCVFEITDRIEMGQMASMFFNKVGVNLFYVCIIIYLYGDLAIYAAAVPVSLMQVTCSAGAADGGNRSLSMEDGRQHNDTDQCWGPVRRIDAYRIYLAAFTLLLGPFTFFNVQKTKYLQIVTSLMRWIAPPGPAGVPGLWAHPGLLQPAGLYCHLLLPRRRPDGHVHPQLRPQRRREPAPPPLLPGPLPCLHHQHQLPHHRCDSAQQLEDPVPSRGRHVPLGCGPRGFPHHHAGAPHPGGLLHPRPGGAGGRDRGLRRQRHPVRHPRVPGLLQPQGQPPGGWRGSSQPARLPIPTHLLGGLCAGLGPLLFPLCHSQHRPQRDQALSPELPAVP